MLKIFEYLGIVLFFYSNEHEQIHVHGKYGEYESKAEIFIANEQIVEIRIKTVKGRRPLTGTKLKDFENFLQAYADQIVQKWIDYFAYRKNIVFEQINTPIR